MIQGRRQHVAAGLTPIGKSPDRSAVERIGRLIASLKAVFPGNAQDSDARLIVGTYLVALAGYPEWAIEAACRRFLDGRAGKGSYAPTPPELARECSSLVTPLYEEQAALDRILEANTYREVPADERERLTAEFNKFAEELRWSNDMGKPDRDRRAAERKYRSKEEVEQEADADLARLIGTAEHFKPLASPELAAQLAPILQRFAEDDRIAAESRERDERKGRAAA